MEPVEAKVKYVSFTKIVEVKEVFVQRHVSGAGPQAVFRDESQGWFVYMEGSYEALCVGAEKPDMKPGDRIKITLENATP